MALQKNTGTNKSIRNGQIIILILFIGGLLLFDNYKNGKEYSLFSNRESTKMETVGDISEKNNDYNSSTSSNNKINPKIDDISSYINENIFSVNGDGNVSFVNGTIIIKAKGNTLQGNYKIIGNKTARIFNFQVIDGNFDPSNNRTSNGVMRLNENGTLTLSLSDGYGSPHEYNLIPN